MQDNKSKKGYVKLAVFVALIVMFFILDRKFGWTKTLVGGDLLMTLKEQVNENFFKSAIIYVVVMAVACVVLAVPGVTFAIIAGAVFGPWWGTLLCVLSATLGAIASFLAGRYFLKDTLQEKVRKNRHIDKLLFNDKTKSEMTVLMITRLVPLFPFNLQNFAYGITEMPLSKYSLGTFIFMIPGTAMYTFGVSAITDGANRFLYIALTVVISVAVIFISKMAKKRYVEDGSEKDINDGNDK